MNKKKTITAAVVLMLVLLVGGLVAYFTDTDEKTNTFTIGSVDITLTEPLWDQLPDTNPQNNIKDKAENMMPGDEVTKDPTINNISTKNDAYVFAKVVVPCSTATTPIELFDYTPNTGWTELTSAAVACTNGGTATHVYYYGSNNTLSKLDKAANDTTPTSTDSPVFSSVKLHSTLKSEEIPTGNKNIVVTGYGIQADGLESTVPATVWGYFSN